MKRSQQKPESQNQWFVTEHKKYIRMLFLSFLVTFISLAIVGTQVFYPFHVFLGLSLYILSYIPLIYKMYVSKDQWSKLKAYRKTRKFFKREQKIIFALVLISFVVLVYFVLRPIGGDAFDNLNDNEIQQLVEDDLYKSVTAMDYLETTGAELIQSLQTEDEDINTTENIIQNFESFLSAIVFSESITDVHRHFNDIPYGLWDERVVSFSISYSLYVKKYELLHRVMTEVSGSEYKKKVLNQYIASYEKNNIYNEMVSRFYAPKTRLRISAGRLYLKLFNDITIHPSQNSYNLLLTKAEEGYDYLFKNFDETLLNSGEVLVDKTKSEMFEVWLPVQRGVANTMGHTIISTRGHNYLIGEELISEMKPSMLPGDFMLQRRNWHLSNVGIPGFWTHAALYTGTLEEMDMFFADEFPYDGYDQLSAYIEEKHPDVYKTLSIKDTDGNRYSVIEAIEPGVVLQSLEKSAHADFVAVLRPNLTKRDKMLALFKAFSHFGKPYDYNFDFDTQDSLVCSELVYDAYFEKLPEKNGIHIETTLVNGRKIVSPLDMAKKFQAESSSPDAEYEFVYFIVSDEDTKNARIADRDLFLESVDWNKFSFMQKG